MNPFEKAWVLLKMTPEEMEAQGFRAAAEQMRQMQAQEEQVRQEGQATAPKMTPQAQSYQQQIDAKRAKEEQGQRIRVMLKEGRQLKQAREMVEQFYQQHGHYPPKIGKKITRRLDQLRERRG
jgi:hypothetical protein